VKLGIDLMLVQKFLELIGIEIGQHPVASHKSWNVSLVGKLFHLRVCLSILADINNIEAIAFLGEILLRVNAPRTPFATIKLQFHGDCGNKQERSAPSIPMAVGSRVKFGVPRLRGRVASHGTPPKGGTLNLLASRYIITMPQ
jgi:hypothetical protein